MELTFESESTGDPLSLAVTGTLSAFRGHELVFRPEEFFDSSLDNAILLRLIREGFVDLPPLSPPRKAEALQVQQVEELAITSDLRVRPIEVRNEPRPDVRALLLYVLGPDPLEMLFHRVAGIPVD